MAVQYRTADGHWHVHVVELSLTPNHRDAGWIRIKHFGFYVADVRSIEALV